MSSPMYVHENQPFPRHAKRRVERDPVTQAFADLANLRQTDYSQTKEKRKVNGAKGGSTRKALAFLKRLDAMRKG